MQPDHAVAVDAPAPRHHRDRMASVRKPWRDEPNHEPGVEPVRTPLDCTRCEGTGGTRTARVERDQDGAFDGDEVVKCSNCAGTGREPA